MRQDHERSRSAFFHHVEEVLRDKTREAYIAAQDLWWSFDPSIDCKLDGADEGERLRVRFLEYGRPRPGGDARGIREEVIEMLAISGREEDGEVG